MTRRDGSLSYHVVTEIDGPAGRVPLVDAEGSRRGAGGEQRIWGGGGNTRAAPRNVVLPARGVRSGEGAGACRDNAKLGLYLRGAPPAPAPSKGLDPAEAELIKIRVRVEGGGVAGGEARKGGVRQRASLALHPRPAIDPAPLRHLLSSPRPAPFQCCTPHP